MANDPTPAPAKSAEAQALEKQFKIPDVTPLEGNITSDGTFIESRILAGKTLAQAFRKLGEAIHKAAVFKNKTKAQLLLLSSTDIALIESYAGIEAQLVLLQKQYDALNSSIKGILNVAMDFLSFQAGTGSGFESLSGTTDDKAKAKPLISPLTAALPAMAALSSGPLAVGFAGAAILKTAIDVASLFRVDTDFKNFDVPVDELTIVAGLRKEMLGDWTLWDPAIFPTHTIRKPDLATSEFLRILADIQIKSGESQTLVAQINDKIEDINAALASEQNPANQMEIKARMDSLTGCAAAINALNTCYISVKSALTTVDPGTKTSPLTNILKAERLIRIVQTTDTYIVKLAAVSKGSSKVSKSRFSSAVIRHSAGTELSCVIATAEGNIVFSHTALAYTPYMDAEDVRAE